MKKERCGLSEQLIYRNNLFIMRNGFLILSVFLCVVLGAQAQKVVLKNNLVQDVFATPNLSLEMAMGKKTTFDLSAGLNVFASEKDTKKFKHYIIQPELRFWTCERFNGWFFGVHALAGQYNMANYKLPLGLLSELETERRQGWFAGAGVGVGYQWVLSRRWSLEAELGGGYVYTDYDRFACGQCGTRLGSDQKHYLGLTKAAVSLVYVIK